MLGVTPGAWLAVKNKIKLKKLTAVTNGKDTNISLTLYG